MSYDLHIGEAEVEAFLEDGEYQARWVVKYHTEKKAPNYKGDRMTGNSNSRYPGYIQWADFCSQTGLNAVFYDDYTGLINHHPGCFLLTEKHLEAFKLALKRQERKNKFPAGTGKRKDYNKVRLKWLIWWTGWALKNCKRPAISNS